MEHSSDDQQQEEAWGGDLRSGVAQVFAESKRKAMLGIRVGAAWSVLLLVYAGLDFYRVLTVASVAWQVAGGLAGLLFVSLALSRTAVPLLFFGVLVVVDLVFLSYQFSELANRGAQAEFLATGFRVAAGPAVLYFVLNGYLGLLSIEAFKNGFSPGQDWRTRVNPVVMKVLIVLSCAGALAVGFGSWGSFIFAGFEKSATWTRFSWWEDTFELQVGGMDTKGKKATLLKVVQIDGEGNVIDGAGEMIIPDAPRLGRMDTKGERGAVLNVVLIDGEGNVIDGGSEMVIPETVYPVDSLEGLDAYAKREAEDAYYFAETSTEAECLAEANGRQDRCRDDRCRYWARFFARACLTKAKPTEFFCDTVPTVRLVAAGITWAQGLCAGREFESCREMLYAVQGHCHPPDPILDPKSEAGPDPDAVAEPE